MLTREMPVSIENVGVDIKGIGKLLKVCRQSSSGPEKWFYIRVRNPEAVEAALKQGGLLWLPLRSEVVRVEGIGPSTFELSVRRSTTELHAHTQNYRIT